MLSLDREIFLFFNQLGSQQWDWLWIAISNKWVAIPLYAVLLYLIFRKFGVKASLVTMVAITLLITATDQLADFFKHTFERPRPCGQEGFKEYIRFVAGHCGRYSYFSAHASNSAGVAVFLGLLFRRFYSWFIYLLIFWALIVSYSRIYLGVHYPTDILTGLVVGGVIGFMFYRIHQFLMEKLREHTVLFEEKEATS